MPEVQPAKHERTRMEYAGYGSWKRTYKTGRTGAIWFNVFRCPRCGNERRTIFNLDQYRDKEFFCEGGIDRCSPT